MRTADNLARYDSGAVCPVTVVVKTADSPVSDQLDEAIVHESGDASYVLLKR